MLEQYLAESQRIELEVDKHKEEMQYIQDELKPIEEKLKPFYDRIRELKNMIEYEKQELHRGYYMLVRETSKATTWLEKIGGYTRESTPGKINNTSAFKQISSNASYAEAEDMAYAILSSWNSGYSTNEHQQSKRELVAIIHFDRKKVYQDGKAISIDKWIQLSKQESAKK